MINEKTIDKYSIKIRYNLQYYFSLYNYFVNYLYNDIINYYTKSNVKPNNDAFNNLKNLLQESEKIASLVKIYSNQFNMFDEWELTEYIEDIRINLVTINNTWKYSNTTKSPNSWNSSGSSYEYTMSDGDTFEKVVAQELKSNNSNNDWVGLSISNNIFEEHYENGDNTTLLIQRSADYSGGTLVLNSVVDTLSGKKLYGLDIKKKFKFSSVKEDIDVCNYIETFKQDVDILLNMIKGSVPEYPFMGIDITNTIGNNANVFNYIKLKNDISATISTDDTIRNFWMLGAKIDGSSVYISYQFDSFYNIIYNKTLKLS
jgi:hypothetical protein